MTPDEIRTTARCETKKLDLLEQSEGANIGTSSLVWVLGEIAAQLSEANQHIARITGPAPVNQYVDAELLAKYPASLFEAIKAHACPNEKRK